MPRLHRLQNARALSLSLSPSLSSSVSLRESTPISRTLKRIACISTCTCRFRMCTCTHIRYMRMHTHISVCVYTSIFVKDTTCTRAFIEIRHRRSFRREAAESRRRNNRVLCFFDLLEIESIATVARKMHLHGYQVPSSGLHDRHRAL